MIKILIQQEVITKVEAKQHSKKEAISKARMENIVKTLDLIFSN